VASGKEKPRDQRGVERTNELLCKKLGIPQKGMHAYRHAFATRLLKTSQDFKAISQIMGHSNIAITQQIYNHPTDEQKQNVINSAFSSQGSTTTGESGKPRIVDSSSGGCIDYQQQIQFLQGQINELRSMVSMMAQYISDKQNIEYEDRNNRNSINAKYKVTSFNGRIDYYKSKKEMLEDLDITSEELKDYLAGDKNLVTELGVEIEVL
jgi:hypothetical protein